MRGFLDFWVEGGHEGGYWTFIDQGDVPNSLCQDTSHEYSHDKRHTLKDGDKLTVFDKDNPAKIVWKGTVSLTGHPYTEQKELDRTTWARWFYRGYPAEFFPAPEKKTAPHK